MCVCVCVRDGVRGCGQGDCDRWGLRVEARGFGRAPLTGVLLPCATPPQPHLEGLTVAECIDACEIEGATDAAIREAVSALVEHGHLYATIDDEHYLATDPVAALNLVDEPIVVPPPPGLVGVGALVGAPARRRPTARAPKPALRPPPPSPPSAPTPQTSRA